MKMTTVALALILSTAPLLADADADARAALALALATNKRTADLEKRVAAVEARLAPRVGHADVPDPFAPNGFWIRPGSAGPATGMDMTATPYAEVRRRVEAGDKVMLIVGPQPAGFSFPARVGYVTLRTEDAPLAAGLYACVTTPTGPVLEVVTPTTVRGVAGPVPFAATTWATTPPTTVLPAAGVSTSRSVGWGLTRTRTVAPLTAPFGGITINGSGIASGGCANGQCGVPDPTVGRFAPFGGFFRR